MINKQFYVQFRISQIISDNQNAFVIDFDSVLNSFCTKGKSSNANCKKFYVSYDEFKSCYDNCDDFEYICEANRQKAFEINKLEFEARKRIFDAKTL